MLKDSEEKNQSAMPESRVYLAGDIMAMLRIGKTAVYDFLNQVYKNKKPFIVLKIGKSVRVPKEPFDKWFYQEIQEEVQ